VTVTSNGSYFACALLRDAEIRCWQDYGSATNDYLGAGIDSTGTDGGVTYGAWHPIDLGTHP
jgi:hypothetical protein